MPYSIRSLALVLFASFAMASFSPTQAQQSSVPEAAQANSAQSAAKDKPVDDKAAAGSSNLAGSLKIVKLLWKSNPKAAASTLAKSLQVALQRNQQADLPDTLEPLREMFSAAAEASDSPLRSVSIAALALARPSDATARKVLREAIQSSTGDQAELLIQVWFAVDRESAFEFFATSYKIEPQLATLPLLMQYALATDRNRAAGILLDAWDKWPRAIQLAAIEPMTAQASTMLRVVKAVEAGRLPRDLVNTNQLRKWQSSGDSSLVAAIEAVWGRVRESDDAERQKLVQDKLALLRKDDSRGSIQRGQVVFNRVCAQCHQLHGQGFEVGPAITNNGRGNLEQLVSNILDPSLVIGTAFQAKTVLTADGEVVSGLVVADDERFLKLKIQGGKVLEFSKADDIEQVRASTKSLMPEGLEAQMTDQEFIDLLAYLCLVKAPDAPDNELISGTPPQLVNP